MSSLPSNDQSCMLSSGQLSCDAMTELAKAEAQRNLNMMSYQVVHPICQRFQTLADREEEYLLQKPSVYGKKACFSQTDKYQDGPWKKQFEYPSATPQFDTWSRRKGA